MHPLFTKRLAAVVAALAVALAPAIAFSKSEAQDGVKVDKMSSLRKLVPEKRLEAMASQQYTGIKQQASQKHVLASPDNPQLQRVRKIAERLIPHTQRWNPRAGQWAWEINLIEMNSVNAFCLPGGKIGVFSGLVDRLKLKDDEIAIVLGHEMAHALREHGRERMAKGVLLQLGAALGSAALGLEERGQRVVGHGVQLSMLKFSRDDETEADLVGLDIVARAGYDPRAGVALWQKMGMMNKNGPPQWLSTHPAGKNRIAQMEKHLPDVMPLFARSKGTHIASLPPYQSNVAGIAPVR